MYMRCDIYLSARFNHVKSLGQNNKFLSLTPTSGNCDNVDTTLNLQQYISQNGAWQGFKRFSFHKAKYLVNFQSFNAADFSSYMTTIFGTVLKDLGEQAKSLPLYWNLITWATYTHYTFKQQGKEESVTTFGFIGDTSTIFNRQNRINAISNSEKNCRGQSNSYDHYHGIASQVTNYNYIVFSPFLISYFHIQRAGSWIVLPKMAEPVTKIQMHLIIVFLLIKILVIVC